MSAASTGTSTSAAAGFTSSERSAQISESANEGYNSLDVDSFLKLLINELQNQDPLDPVDNAQMVQQIGQIREIGATDQLTNTLSDLSNSQQLVTASGLIGRTVSGLADDQSNTTGVVDKITVETNEDNQARSVKVHVGQKTMEIENIRQIQTE
ncbi:MULTISPECIES: flagellar hook assembly protein FlgD [Rhodopirellula]|jgi:flagellar basal-body rod modification protein FlgD|uniref:Basal-body rod modification protein FlgD n=2 Tax=Rhodopirellula europaea TaxID=1263866 RepID=M2AX56_9BACT|nr:MULTISPECIES: flagellar hook capping FlgD N-terminal domain-containing protein [Rhodopirellula]EMB14143.1 flagellar hook capping protein [Rhodopirellula europaea 6C]EMI23867.1 basal-body rod modification protein FlgD [Rhodopirellula europaea SH398]MCR9208939.1 flagellar biosynthesis protein FlgD [bacterium]|tara:strand:+ start:162 stop:623 length:462 start_codon:yes stop_codon:yes gene_type:complete